MSLYLIGDQQKQGRQVYSVGFDGIYTPIGNPITLGPEGSNDYPGTSKVYDKVIDHYGDKYLIWSTGLAKLNRTTNNWEYVYSSSSWSTNNLKFPLISHAISGMPYILGGTIASTNSQAIFFKYDSINNVMNTVGPISLGGGSYSEDSYTTRMAAMISGVYVSLHTQCNGGGGGLRCIEFRPMSMAVSEGALTGGNAEPSLNCAVHKGRLYTINKFRSSNEVWMGRVNSYNSISLFDNVTDAYATAADLGTNLCLFSDGNFLYGVYNSSTQVGLKFMKYDLDENGTLLSKENITANVALWTGYSAQNNKGCLAIYRPERNKIYLLISAAFNITHSYEFKYDVFEWNGPNTQLLPNKVGSFCGTRSQISIPLDGGGNKIYIKDKVDSFVTKIEKIDDNGIYRIHYAIFPNSRYTALTPIKVSFKYSLNDSPTVTNNMAALKIGSASEGSVVANYIEGLTIGSGYVRTVDWLAVNQGAVPGKWIRVTPRVELV